MSRPRSNQKGRYSHRRFDPRTDYRERKGRRRTERVLGRGAIVGLMLLTAVFIGGLAVMYWSEPEPQAKEPSSSLVSNKELSAPATQLPIEDKNALSRQIASSPTIATTFDHCGMIRRTCVVDGDTFWLNGTKIRISDIDTPEVSQPKCGSEKALGDRATARLIELLNLGPFELHAIGNRDADRYGRKLRVVVRNGRSLGDQLVREGLARTWTGKREPWC